MSGFFIGHGEGLLNPIDTKKPGEPGFLTT